ncbi:MAG: ABC transporter ATP-binding protein [Gammaproteobacteria bacterium]|nr:ABC transporter ATP-binding protein [Gammaproteobacteria bacterium]
MAELVAKRLTVFRGESLLVDAASFTLAPGELVVLLGPNGAGKTTLIRAALGLLQVRSGSAKLNGTNTRQLSPSERARQIAYLPQVRQLAWPNQVKDVVSLGRFSHGAVLGKLTGRDAAAVERVLAACDLKPLAHRKADTLSGGELARVHCARAFATEAPLLIADEPTAALDPWHQFRNLDLIESFVREGGGALLVLHDFELAARYATRLLWMKDGRIVEDGSPAKTLTAERLSEVYRIAAHVESGRVVQEGAL